MVLNNMKISVSMYIWILEFYGYIGVWILRIYSVYIFIKILAITNYLKFKVMFNLHIKIILKV